MLRHSLILLSLIAGLAQAQPGYSLAHTEVHPLHAQALQRHYQLFVSLPASYEAEPKRRYPVLFITDADYGFPLLRSIAKRVGDQGRGLEDFILIGLSYAEGDSPTVSRNRDYTPSPRRDGGGSSKVYGEAEAYRRYLADEVLPYVAKTWRVDMGRKVFAGHSYGGLLGAHILLNTPKMFEHYILSSPSLWYDDDLLMKRAKAVAARHEELPAHVLLLAGARERPRGAREEGDDIVGGIRRFEATLRAGKLRGLTIESQLLADEDHLTAAPSAFTRGLRWALPGKR